jgi:hypothetical protein
MSPIEESATNIVGIGFGGLVTFVPGEGWTLDFGAGASGAEGSYRSMSHDEVAGSYTPICVIP